MVADLPFDDPPSPEEQAEIARLTTDQIAYIDKVLLANVVDDWRKLARVVAECMNATESELPEVPVIYFAQRAMALRDAGLIESQGNLRRMRYSEVRLPQEKL
ncbi:MAG: hypothetical protein JNJ55_10530 [Betaproteobacteria bacterium]|nr:hypothetical protein [Betaproteobacteria bacterium]